MKKLIFIPFLFLCLTIFSQRVYTFDSLQVAVDTDTTASHRFYANDAWSIEVNSTNVDGVDTLYLYCAADADSTTYPLIWVDQDLDGSNDNPWTLSASTNLLIWGDEWPCRFIVYKLAVGTSTAGKKHYYNETKR